LFVGFVRQTKLAVRQLLGAHKYSLSYRNICYVHHIVHASKAPVGALNEISTPLTY